MLGLARFRAVCPQVVHRGQARRSFVSPVLLTRTWENENVTTLRKEAKNRGISSKGPKANLILRITEYDSKGTPKHVTNPTPAKIRSASSSPRGAHVTRESTTHTVAPGPGVSSAAASSAPPPKHDLFNVILPDLSQPDPEPPVEVPYVPDFWDSTAFKKQAETSVTEDLPKMVVVGGVSTHNLGPTHGLHDLDIVTEVEDVTNVTGPTAPNSVKSSGETTVFEDITQDLGLPPPKELRQSIWKLFS